jgi:uncharacterized protein YhaN
MKIDQLQLIAYGPFSDRELDFSNAGRAFHLIYGANEAGKSSALRALRNLLFGIPVRTRDSFRHPHPKLRIGARLTRSDGNAIAFIRRKGQLKTLRGPDDQSVLEETALQPFLGGVDRELFEQMFAIGHDELIQGGEEIIAGGGSVGQALFAAGAGLLRLQAFRQRLETEAEDLFKTAGKKPRINRTLSDLKATRHQQRTALLQIKTWQTHQTALVNARERLKVVEQDLAARQRQQDRLKRIQEALPLMARRHEINTALEAYAGIPDLTEKFSATRREAENSLQIADRDRQRAQTMIEELHQQVEALEVPEQLLAHGALVEALQQDLGSFNKARKDRPGLEARMQLLYRQAASGLSADARDAPKAPAEVLELSPVLISEIQALGQRHERLQTRLETTREDLRHLAMETTILEEQRDAMTAPAIVEGLKTALQALQDAGPLEKQLATARSDIAAELKNLNQALQRQDLWSGNLEGLDDLVTPSEERITQFDTRFEALARQLARQQAEQEQKAEELARNDIELRAMIFAQDVPTEEDLTAARSRRDTGWRLVRRRLEGRTPDTAAEHQFGDGAEAPVPLPEAFETSMQRADQIADRLRREAEQVSRKSLLEARQTSYAQERRTIETAIQTTRKAQNDLDHEWRQIWAAAGIQPASPVEMRSWLNALQAIRDKFDRLRSQQSHAERVATEIARLKTRLARAMATAGKATDPSDSLADLGAKARSYVDHQEKRQARMDAITQEILKNRQNRQTLQAALTDLEADHQEWRSSWAQKVARLGLAADTGPQTALAVIERLREARRQRDEADILRKRIQGIDRDADDFRARVDDLVVLLAPDLKGQPRDRTAQLLNARLNTARESQTARKSLQQQLSKARTDQDSAQKRLDDAQTLIQTLCREADCQQPDDLPAVERRAAKRRQLMAEREALDDRLRRLGAGATVETFIDEAATMAVERIISDLEQLSRDIETLEQERAALHQTIGTERAELKHMDGRAAAAAHAEEAEGLLARLDADVEKYARLKLASAILARTIEQYREKHQGPLIKRASDLFARMTTGAFSGLRAEYDEQGSPVLVGLRVDNDEQVKVDALSDGTADQLYLALRLASIEQYLGHSEALPFVVDDILLRFDDARSVATLEVLAEIAEHTQVIFFTHHRHMLDLARRTIPESLLQVHRL